MWRKRQIQQYSSMKENTSDRAVCVHFVPNSQACEECSKNTRSTLSDKYLELLSLVDGAKEIVEIYTPTGPYNAGWKKRWLARVNALLKEYDSNNNNSYEQRSIRKL